MNKARRSLLIMMASMFGLMWMSGVSASKGDPACKAYDPPTFAQKRVCENATLNELERRLGNLLDELENGWHIKVRPTDENWRGSLAACQSDACLEAAYRKRLGTLDALPTFSCAGKLKAAERAVCEHPVLGRLDRELNLSYGQALDASYTLLALRADQGRWRLNVRDGCAASVSCLGRAYRARVAVLRRLQMLAAQRQRREVQSDNPQDTRGTGLKLKFTPAQQKSIQAQLGSGNEDGYINDADHAQGNCLSKPVDLLDLNRDGHPEPMFMTCGGAHNELAFFFLWQSGQYRLVLTDTVGYFGYQQQDTRMHGLPVLRLITHGSCCVHPSTYYAYDGRQYRAVACYNEHFLRDDFYTFEDLGKPEGGSCMF